MSDDAADKDRYVRNMNVLSALAFVQVGKAENDRELSEIGSRALMSERAEIASGNRGYLARLDPIWLARPGESERIENHAAFVATALEDSGLALGDQNVRDDAFAMWWAWSSCTERRCKAAGCAYWAGDAQQCQRTATGAHCAFRFRSDQARAQCNDYLARATSISSFALWSLLLAQPR